MTPEERLQAFINAYNAITAEFGYQLQANIIPHKVGEVQIGVKADLQVTPVSNWTEPTAKEAQ